MIPLSIVKWIIIFRARIVPIFQKSCCRFSNLDKRMKILFYKQEKKAIFLTKKKNPEKNKSKNKNKQTLKPLNDMDLEISNELS